MVKLVLRIFGKVFKTLAGMVMAAEQIKPVITGCEIKLTINPRRHKPRAIRIIPVKKLSVTAIFGSDVISGGVCNSFGHVGGRAHAAATSAEIRVFP